MIIDNYHTPKSDEAICPFLYEIFKIKNSMM